MHPCMGMEVGCIEDGEELGLTIAMVFTATETLLNKLQFKKMIK